MIKDDGVIRSIAWQDLCAWTLLFRLFRLALSFQILILALFGVALTHFAWSLNNRFLSEAEAAISLASVSVVDTPVVPQFEGSTSSVQRLAQLMERSPVYLLVEPWRRLFAGIASGQEFAYLVVGSLASLVIWCVIGGAITRIAVVRLGRDERVGLRESVRFSTRKLLSYAAAPLLPLSTILLLWLPLFMLGALMRTDLGVAFAGLIWLPVGLITFSMVMFSIGCFFGWPLMWAAISAEGSDAFDAISRAYAYTFQRPLHYLLYALGTIALGLLGWGVVKLFCETMVHFAMLGIATGAGGGRFAELQPILEAPATTSSSLAWFGASMIRGLNVCFRSVQCAFGFAFLWTGAAGIYLLLRRDADNTEIESVYLPEDVEVAFELPKLSLEDEAEQTTAAPEQTQDAES